jgi:DNA-binding NarL/FixJ family response regulator
MSAASSPGPHTRALLETGEPGTLRALHTCLRLFEALGDDAGADACRRALALEELRDRPTSSGGLTQRELRVAELMAAGATNREIAQAMGISPGTVGRHAANIFLKLGFHTRAQVASWYASTSS